MAKSMTRSQKLYVVLIAVLVVIYVVKYVGIKEFELPTRSRIDREKRQIETLRAQLVTIDKIRENRRNRRQTLKDQTAGFWFAGDTAPTNQIQSKITRIGSRSGVTLNRLSAPKVIQLTDFVRAVEVQVQCNTNAKDFSRFCREIDNHEPRLFWADCNIRPNRTKDPTEIVVKGKVRALVLNYTVRDYIAGAAPQ